VLPVTAAEWDLAWARALDALELDLEQTELLLRADHVNRDVALQPFTPPVGLGVLPNSLEARARALLQRQIETSAQLAQAMHTTRRQLSLLNRMETGSDGGRPLYVDSAV
jgi:hypothetical protein